MSVTINNDIITVTLTPPPMYQITATLPVLPVVIGLQGPAGPSTTTLSKTAGETLSGHRVVIVGDDGLIYYADKGVDAHKHKVLGITTGAANSGATATIHSYGAITEPSWIWTMGLPVWLSTQGQLTQTPPTSGFILEIGFPLSATTLFVDIDKAITLA